MPALRMIPSPQGIVKEIPYARTAFFQLPFKLTNAKKWSSLEYRFKGWEGTRHGQPQSAFPSLTQFQARMEPRQASREAGRWWRVDVARPRCAPLLALILRQFPYSIGAGLLSGPSTRPSGSAGWWYYDAQFREDGAFLPSRGWTASVRSLRQLPVTMCVPF